MQEEYEEELLKHCANEESDINKIAYLLNQSGVDPNNIYDEVLKHFVNYYYYCDLIILQSGRTLLWWVCYLGRSSHVIILLESGADVDLPTDVNKFTAMIAVDLATFLNRMNTVNLLLLLHPYGDTFLYVKYSLSEEPK